VKTGIRKGFTKHAELVAGKGYAEAAKCLLTSELNSIILKILNQVK